MTLYPCSQEHEVTAALRDRRWPDACPPELRTHVAACSQCHELVLVAQTLQQARQQAIPMANLASPGLLWWRAQIRRRNEALEKAAKPIAFAEALALAGTLVVAAVLAFMKRGELLSWLNGLPGISSGSLSLGGLWPAGLNLGFWTVLIASAVTLGLVGGLAVYLNARSD